jgi:hypothetical protein
MLAGGTLSAVQVKETGEPTGTLTFKSGSTIAGESAGSKGGGTSHCGLSHRQFVICICGLIISYLLRI